MSDEKFYANCDIIPGQAQVHLAAQTKKKKALRQLPPKNKC